VDEDVHMLTLLLLFATTCVARVLRIGSSADYSTIHAALAAARPGDTLQLVDSHYDLNATLVIDRSLVLETAPEVVSAVVRLATPNSDIVVAINANDVTLRNLVFGRSPNERTIDVFVSSGTANQQSSVFPASTNYNGDGERQERHKTRAISSELLDKNARDDTTRTNRAIRGFTLENVDFGPSTSATNVAFDTGAYIGVSIRRCKFGQRDLTDAIVTVPGARFADSAPLTFNAFDKSRLKLAGVGLTLGTNYWAAQRPIALASTYCVDRHCTMLGPVVDADEPTSQAYGSIASALGAGVQHVLVTAASVEWGVLNGPITTAGTTVRGAVSDHCAVDDAVPLVTIDSSVVSARASLVAVSDLRFELSSGVTTPAFSYVSSAGGEAGDVLFERVTMLAENQQQTLLTLSSESVTLTLSRCAFVAGNTGVRVLGGALVVADSAFTAQAAASIAIGGSGVGTGLRVSGSEFSGSPSGSIVFERSVSSAVMLPISISCSRFIMAPFVEPSDCLRNAQQCANALRYNTFIEVLEPTPLVANRRFLAHGNNHVERVAASQLAEFTSLAHSGGSTFSFSFVDKQGRFGKVRADVALQQHAANQFVLASNVPMRQECFAESVPGQRVVSGLFSLTTDAPARCVSLALQFTVVQDDADNSTASSHDDVAVYDVKHLGNSVRGSAVWSRAASNAVLSKAATNSYVVEASSGAGALLQAVVVAQKLTEKESAVLLAQGEAVSALPRATQRFCVACGGDQLPAYVVDERCGGGASGTHLFTDFDTALGAANEAGRGGDVVSLLVYGSKCTMTQCNARVTAASLTIEGFSVSAQSTLRRPASCAPDTPMLTLAAPSATVRYMLLTPDSKLASAVPECAVELAQNDCRVSFCTISGGVCANDADGQIVGNEIVGSSISLSAVVVSADSSNTLVQSNVISAGQVVVQQRARGTRIDRNTFASTAELASEASVTLTGNTFVDRSVDQSATAACVTLTDAAGSALTSTGDLYGAHCRLLLAGGGKIRVTGKKQAAPWVDVVVKLSDTSDVRLANIDLLGANAQIVLVDPGAKDVVLYDVGIDLEQSTLADTLLGRPFTRTPCSATNEPPLGGFALPSSLIMDAKTRQMLLGGGIPKLKPAEFISPINGATVHCSSAPEDDYCRCIASEGVPLTTTTRRPPKTQPPVTIVAKEIDLDAKPKTTLPNEPLDDDVDAGLDAVLPQTLAAAVKKVLPQSVRKYRVAQAARVASNEDEDEDDIGTRFTGSSSDDRRRDRGGGGLSAGWIVGIVLIVLVVIVLIIVACCFCYPGWSTTTRTTRRVVQDDDGSETVVETVSATANAGRRAGKRGSSKSPQPRSSMGVALDSADSESGGEVASGIKFRKVTRRAGAGTQ
jgi:hypothetical protein